jgi:hypothetical protein
MSDLTPSSPTERYGRRAAGVARARWVKVVAVTAIAGAVAVAAWFAFAQSDGSPVTAEVVSFHVINSERMDVTFQVSMPAGSTAVCTLGALAQDFAQVGSHEVTVGPSTAGTAQYAATVQTSSLAVAATIDGCIPGP